MTDLSILKENFSKYIEDYEKQDVTFEQIKERNAFFKLKALMDLETIEKSILEGVYDETELVKNIKELVGLGVQIGIANLLKYLGTMEEKDGQRNVEKEV